MNPGDAKLGQFYNMRAPCFRMRAAVAACMQEVHGSKTAGQRMKTVRRFVET